MNKQQVKGNLNQAAGEIQQQVGKLVGNKEQQVKGLAREKAGEIQEKVGDVKEVLKDGDKR